MRYLLLALLFSVNSFAAQQEWTVYDQEHPLWTVLKVEQTGTEQNREKKVGPIVCNRILGFRLQTTCVFPEGLKPGQIYAFYKAIQVKPMESNDAYSGIKLVDQLIVIGDDDTNEKYNTSRFFLDHPCREVKNQIDARNCMNFWAESIFTSFEEPNNADVVAADDKHKALVQKTLSYMGYSKKYVKQADELLENADYIGLMLEHQDEHHLFYFAIHNGKNVVPKEIMELNEADIQYAPVAELAKTVAASDLDAFVQDVIHTLLLGLDPSPFDFVSYVEESLRYGHEEGNQ